LSFPQPAAIEVQGAECGSGARCRIVAAHLAAAHPSLVTAAILIGPVYPSAAVTDVFSKRIALVEKEGMEAMANTIPTTPL